ncbi:Uncharacterised protein [Mycobacteroides abscessus subsp. abscessus]|nr:Uncharacterised protein [Mycobacteroides abscessus subsp. abscessus]
MTPERVAQWKPASFSLSTVCATTIIGNRSARSLMIADCTFLCICLFTNGYPWGSSSLNRTRPRVVSATQASPGCQPFSNSSASTSAGGRCCVSRTRMGARTLSAPRSIAMMASAGELYTPTSG